MVSGPVADLLTPKYNDSYIEYKNTSGDSLRFQIFTKDGVKMFSLNGIVLPLDELFNVIQEAEGEAEAEAEAEAEDEDLDENYDNIIIPCALITLVSFLMIMLYMRNVFAMAF